jgi:hypothetical protein
MESRPMLTREPFQKIVINPGDEYGYIVATKGDGYIMVYTPLGNDIELDGNQLAADQYKVTWFDPRSGKTLAASTINKRAVMKFQPPSKGPGFDWVLILDQKT